MSGCHSRTGLRYRKHQRGVIMITALLLIVVLTLIAVSGMENTVIEERMAGNFGQTITAQQAAEAALREVEAWIESDVHPSMFLKCNDTAGSGVDWNAFYVGSASAPNVLSSGNGNVRGLYAQVRESTCNGYRAVYPCVGHRTTCHFDPRDESVWLGSRTNELPKGALSMGDRITVKDVNGNPKVWDLKPVGGSAASGAVARQPKVVVEYLGAYPIGARDLSVRNYQVLASQPKRFMFRITAIGWGKDPNARYVLQSNYQTPL